LRLDTQSLTVDNSNEVVEAFYKTQTGHHWEFDVTNKNLNLLKIICSSTLTIIQVKLIGWQDASYSSWKQVWCLHWPSQEEGHHQLMIC